MSSTATRVLRVARDVAKAADALAKRVGERPSDVVVNVHSYAWRGYEAFLARYAADDRPRVLVLSMNPGRNGAVQTGIPFTDVLTARQLLPDFDRLVPFRPPEVRSERVEMSGQKLKVWATRTFGGLPALYRDSLFLTACPIAVLRGPRRLNVPLPALRSPARTALEAFYEAHAPQLARAAQPRGVLLLGDFAARRWRRVCASHADLARIPAIATHHPAARITKGRKFRDWTRAWSRLRETLGPLRPGRATTHSQVAATSGGIRPAGSA